MRARRTALCAAFVTICVQLAASCGWSGARADQGVVEMTAGRAAAPVRLIARAQRVRVEEVAAPGDRGSAIRLEITAGASDSAEQAARFHVGDARLYVLVDGTPIGRAVLAPDLRSMTVAVVDRELIRDGAVVSYAYGSNGKATVAGSLRMVRR